MRRLCVLAALLFAACGKSSSPPPADPDPGEGVQGSLTVHSSLWENIPRPEVIQGVNILLGDGSRFRSPLGTDGVVHFEDPAIVGPQDVTLMVTFAGDDEVWLFSYLALDSREVWLPIPNGFGVLLEHSRQATIQGRITGSGGGEVFVDAVGKGLTGDNFAKMNADGTFSMNVTGTEPGVVHLVVTELSGDPESRLVRVGLKRDISVGGGQILSGVEIALDHAVDQTQSVNVNGWQDYVGELSASLEYSLDGVELFSTSAKGTPPLAVPAISRTAPFDQVQVRVSTGVGFSETLPAGTGVASVPSPEASALTATLLKPMQVLSPPLGKFSAPAVSPRQGFRLDWRLDPVATRATVRFSPYEASPDIVWTVMAPASITSFTPFVLPAELTSSTTLPSGVYSIEANSSYGAGAYMDDFAQPAAPGGATAPKESRLTALHGWVDLQQ